MNSPIGLMTCQREMIVKNFAQFDEISHQFVNLNMFRQSDTIHDGVGDVFWLELRHKLNKLVLSAARDDVCLDQAW